jgi:hypothetical protein
MLIGLVSFSFSELSNRLSWMLKGLFFIDDYFIQVFIIIHPGLLPLGFLLSDNFLFFSILGAF